MHPQIATAAASARPDENVVTLNTSGRQADALAIAALELSHDAALCLAFARVVSRSSVAEARAAMPSDWDATNMLDYLRRMREAFADAYLVIGIAVDRLKKAAV